MSRIKFYKKECNKEDWKTELESAAKCQRKTNQTALKTNPFGIIFGAFQ